MPTKATKQPTPTSPSAMKGRSKATAVKKAPAAKKTTASKSLIKKTATETALTKIASKPKALARTAPATTDLVAQYRTHKQDTGSTAVQIAQLSDQIADLQKHLKKHAGDNDSRRGLLIMVGKRRRLLNYLGRSDQPQYQQLIVDLKLRK